MADVSKIRGPSGSPQEPGGKEKAAADAEKFKQAMRRRVTEVSKVDPDEQKKRKRREEAEEEENIEGSQGGPTTPGDQVTPFSLEKESKKISPLEMQKGGPGISPTESARPTKPSTSSFYHAPSPAEMEDDSGMLEEEAFIEDVPSEGKTPPHASFGREQASTPPPPAEQPPTYQQTPPTQQPQAAPSTPPQERQTMPAGQLESAQQQRKEQKKKAAAQTVPGEKKKTGSAAALEGTHPSKAQETTAFFEKMGKDGEKGKKEPTAEELEKEAELQGASAAPPAPFSQSLEGKEEKKVEKKEGAEEFETSGLAPGTEMQGAQAAPPSPPEALPAYANLHPQVMELFDRMVGVMTVMSMSGITETTITLNSPQFASSVFFGTQIIIQEFSTAPKAFNIQLNGNPQAIALFQGNTDDLMAAFQAGNYNFRVNRLETGYLTERPLFKRKEKATGKDKDQTGENPR
jgi:hypothetical protein